MEKGKLKKSKIIWKGKDVTVPKEFVYDRDSHKNVECEFEHNNNIATAITVIMDGQRTELHKNQEIIAKKIENKEKIAQEEIARKEQEKKDRDAQRNQSNFQSQGNTNKVSDYFDISLSQIPIDTKRLALENGDNFALKHFKFARFEKNENDISKSKFQFFKTERGKIIYEVKHNNYGFGKNEKEANDKIEKIADQHKRSAKHLFTEGCLEVEIFKPDWRVVVGLGTDSVYETGITLHHIYGFPYIPASAIKGITNHFALDMLKVENQEANDKLGKHKVTDEGMLTIFGSTQQKGKITFFDAMPLTAPKLKPDIMNVHYPDYYGGTSAPTDTQSPRPILFLTVEETKFQFMLGCKEDDKNLLETAFEWLTKALQERGIGAKTAVGYGYMT